MSERETSREVSENAMESSPLEDCSITAHCFVSNEHTGEPGCRERCPVHESLMQDGVCSSCLADAEHGGR